MMKLFIYLFYRPLYAFLKSLIPVFRKKLNAKTLVWLELRQTNTDVDLRSEKNVFWFHASSGEIEYAKAIIRELRKAKPESTIVVTYSSPSAIKLFDNIKSSVNHFIPLPWDQPNAIADLINAINPQAIVFARTDFWPELIYQLKKKNIPSFIASYNPSFNAWNRFFNVVFFNHFKGIFCVHPSQASILNSMLSKDVSIAAPGDTRFDQVFWRLAQPSKLTIPLDFSYGVLGSTWLEDEKVITPILPALLNLGFKLFWAPHETNFENTERIELLLLELKIKYKRFSELMTAQDSGTVIDANVLSQYQVILMDKVGYLADLYRNAAWAFVGGSFKAKVHSVMEPLCCAIPVITGPYITNSPEALRYHQVIMNDLRVVQLAHDSNEFLQSVSAVRSIQPKDFKKMLIGHLEQNRYASVKIIKLILDKLQENVNS
ncbi:MAG: hypothetical protein H7256_07440 [Bdellovibrio sp.]|nr:hypothetical protein [Bdellovibrio sp.]